MKAVRRLQFCAGHRVAGHEWKCKNLHGHNYVAFIHAEPIEDLDNLGRVVDFGVMKQLIMGWIDENWDHRFVAWKQDTWIQDLANLHHHTDGPMQLYWLPDNPTAENMAKHLLEVSNELLADYHIRVTRITLWETENCYAEVERKPDPPSEKV